MIPEPSSGGVPSAHVGDETGPVEPVADTEAVETAVSVQFSFADADVAAECECGWRTIGDAAVDAFSAWWKHRATHDYQPRPVASSSTREDGETSTGEDENGHGLACCSCCYAVPAERERAARFEAQLAASQEEARGIAHTLDKAMSELRDARAELEHRRERVTVLRAERDDLRSELAAERAKAERAEALCDEYRTNCDPDTKQAQVAEIFRAAHVGDETEDLLDVQPEPQAPVPDASRWDGDVRPMTTPVESTPDGGTGETPHRWRKKPVEVEAMYLAPEYDPNDFLDPNTRAHAEIAGWMLGHGFDGFRVAGDRFPHGLDIETLEGTMRADPGDWIIRGVQGEFYPCKPDIFEATYEPADRPVVSSPVQVDGETDAADLLYDAWVLIANARDWHGGDESAEWRQAAIRWRDRWHETLPGGDAPTCSRCGRTCAPTWVRTSDDAAVCYGCATDDEWATALGASS